MLPKNVLSSASRFKNDGERAAREMKLKICAFLFVLITIQIVKCQDLEPFQLDEYLNGAFSNKGFNGVWMSGTEFYYKDSTNNNVYIYNVEAPEESNLLFESDVLSNYKGATFTLSPDTNFILIRHNSQSIFRHSTVAQFTVYGLLSKQYFDLANEELLQYASWSLEGSSIAYVLNNNIYYVSTPSNVTKPVQITSNGENGVIYNGIPDWVYEEEVLSAGSAIWWSPDGSHIAFGYFNDEKVEDFTYFMYGGDDPTEDQYPKVVTLKYPKVGTRNPDFEVKVVSLSDPTNIKTLNVLPSGALSKDYVLFDVTWATNDEVVVVIENRIQNQATIRRCKLSETTCDIENEFVENKGWLEIEAPYYSLDGTKYIMVTSQPEDDDSYQHLVMYDVSSKSPTRLTHGKRVVLNILGWDETRNLIFYVGTPSNSPFQEHVYYYNITDKEDICITCSLKTPEGDCEFASASFSTDYSYFVEMCRGPGPNYIVINSVDGFNTAYPYETNDVLREKLLKKQSMQIINHDFILESGFTAKARLLLPPDADHTGLTKYPMIVNVYGGPDSTQISDRFSTGFQNYIVTNRRYIYCYIDGRGSGNKGDNLRFQIYKKMGTVEIEDQIAVTKALRDTFSFIDPERIGIWGWSYGGFATAWALVKDVENVFRFGLSVAPVTDFLLYDTIYTERYMGLPDADDNQLGYNRTDLSREVESLRDKSFFLIHGNADDNVHYQQSMILSKALERADIMFYQMSYPDENHSLNGVSPHLYHTIDRYWARCFGLPDPQYPKKD
nr:venom dipeptidyl peptidase 4 [Onthophagus taurus]